MSSKPSLHFLSSSLLSNSCFFEQFTKVVKLLHLFFSHSHHPPTYVPVTHMYSFFPLFFHPRRTSTFPGAAKPEPDCHFRSKPLYYTTVALPPCEPCNTNISAASSHSIPPRALSKSKIPFSASPDLLYTPAISKQNRILTPNTNQRSVIIQCHFFAIRSISC